MINKFENVTEMEKSYENLEREFTKKCQELSRLKKDLEERSAAPEVIESGEAGTQENLPVEEEVVAETEVAEGAVEAKVVPEAVPVEAEGVERPENKYGLEFRAKASEFLKTHADARGFAKEISRVLLSDPTLLNCADPFGVAYAIVKANAPAAPVQEVKQVEEGRVEITPEKKVVPVMAGGTKGSSLFAPKPKFRSLEDARDELINRYFG